MTFDIDWWWDYQSEISTHFGFSKCRENVASRIVSRLKLKKANLQKYFKGKNISIIGAAIGSDIVLPPKNLLVADGALRACLERNIIPEFVMTDLDGYLEDLFWASNNGSKLIVHSHGDNIAVFSQYSTRLPYFSVTTTYPSLNSNCWGGFTDGDRALMMALSLSSKSINLLGFNFNEIGDYAGVFSPRKLEKLVWAEKIVHECIERTGIVTVD